MKILVLDATNESELIEEVVNTLQRGGLVIYPTETCYGAGVLAENQAAVTKMLSFKRRPEGKAISIAVADQKIAGSYVELNTEARHIYKNFLPGPVTVISKSTGKAAQGLASEQGTLGIRIPKHDFVLGFLRKLGAGVSATSANSAGKKTPYSINDILQNLTKKQKDLIDLIIDAGELPHNPPSTVIDTTKSEMQVLRQGSLELQEKFAEKIVNSDSEMRQEGKSFMAKIAEILNSKCLLLLFDAELGAGKTQFVKGVAEELNIKEIVKSPTYSLMEEYDFEHKGISGKLIHIDAWRMQDLGEFLALGIEQHIKVGNVIALEWAGGTVEFFDRMLKKSKLKAYYISIKYLAENIRELEITSARGKK